MKTPSRYMPKIAEEPTSIWAWAFLVFLLGLVLWLVWTVPYLLFLVPVFFVLEVWDKRKRKRHYSNLLRDRHSDSLCSFSRHFEFRKIDTWIIRAVYEQLQSHMEYEIKNFPIRPTDDVFVDLKIDEEVFEQCVVEEIAQRTGRTLTNAKSNPYYGKANIVENLVFFFDMQPKSNAT